MAITGNLLDYEAVRLFSFLTDNPLTFVLSTTKPNATGQRWASDLSQYSFNMTYRACVEKVYLHDFSRYPHEQNRDGVNLGDEVENAICW